MPRSPASARSPSRSARTRAAHRTRTRSRRRSRPRSATARGPASVLTLPDNPTGTQPDPHVVERASEIAERHGLLVVADEIYRELSHDPERFRSPTQFVPERAFVTGGLSKDVALGGWRIGFARMPDGPLGDDARRAVAGGAGPGLGAPAAA